MVPSPRKCPGVEGKVCGRFLPPKDHDPHRLCVTCHGKSCTVDDRCAECTEWSDERCRDVAVYIVKLSAQTVKKKERKARSSSFFFRFFANYANAVESPRLYIGVEFDISAVNSCVCVVTYAVSAVTPPGTCHLAIPGPVPGPVTGYWPSHRLGPVTQPFPELSSV